MTEERLTIDELARRVGMTARNVRAHQTRGLLPPPTLAGRIGYYGLRHLERLNLIRRMQEEGLNLGAVAWLLGAKDGPDDPALAQFKRALLEPFATESPTTEDRADLEARLGGPLPPALIERAVALGIVEPVDDRTIRILLPAVVRRAEELVALGVPIAAQLDVLDGLDGHLRDVATAFVGLAEDHLIGSLTARAASAGPGELQQAIEQLRITGVEVVLTLLQRAMTAEVERAFARLAAPDNLVRSPQ